MPRFLSSHSGTSAGKLEYSYHLSIIAGFAIAGAFIGSTRRIFAMDVDIKLGFCAILSALALFGVLSVQSFPVASILFGLCDAMAVLTVAATRTKVQLTARQDHPEALSSILAARSIIIKSATLAGTGACLIVDDFISLRATLALFAIPVALSVAALAVKERSEPVAYEH